MVFGASEMTLDGLLGSLSKGWIDMSAVRISAEMWNCRLRLKCDGTRAETRFRLSGETDEFI